MNKKPQRTVSFLPICKSKTECPISQEKLDNCYTPNGETYPLCKGQVDNKQCKECNLYEDMKEGEY